jgi:Flp pilus assembly protein TadG
MTNPMLEGLRQRFKTDETGVTAVEFALIAPVLMLIIMGTVEVGLMTAAQRMLDNATFTGSRTGKTGYIATGKTQAQTIQDGIKKAAPVLLNPSKITLSSIAYPDYSYIKPEAFTDTNKNRKWDSGEPYVDANNNGKYDDGTGVSGLGSCGQIVVYTATYSWKLFTPLLSRLIGTGGYVPLKSSIPVKNEPYC